MRIMKLSIVGLVGFGLAVGVLGCANTVHGVAKDTSKVGEKVSEAAKTGDVKSALIADTEIDTSAINVDTISETKTVVLRGSVPTEAMKERAEMIARRNSPGYTVQNRLAVAPR